MRISLLSFLNLFCAQESLVGEPFYLSEFLYPRLVVEVFGERDMEVEADESVYLPYLVGNLLMRVVLVDAAVYLRTALYKFFMVADL